MGNKLSLACIAGNAEQYIERFLDSFQPWVDEVVIVCAAGNQKEDRTIQIAESRQCKTGYYTNGGSHENSALIEDKINWPHVDDFAAARNKAFNMATGDFVMWADMDDILENGAAIRADLDAMPSDCLALSVPYDVRDDQLRIMRERVIRKGTARWINPVHEQLDFPNGVKCAETNRWQIVHQPIGIRKANDERNVRILESISNPTGSQRFHLAQSLRAVGRVEDGIRIAAELVTERPADLGTAEIYEMFLFMAQLTTDPDMRARLTLQALATDPTRREAYGDLAMAYVAANDAPGAEAWARAMLAMPMPPNPAWNMRRKYYGYLAPLIHGTTLRRLGRVHEADVKETNHIIRHGAKISLLHATRGRPAMAATTRRKWMERAADPDAIEHIFGLDADDPTAFMLALHRHEWTDGQSGPVAAWNKCAERSIGEILIQLSDDWEPPLHWDMMVRGAIGDTSKPTVLAISDGHRTDDLLCMAVLTRARYKSQGYLFHPEFFSMFSDNWFSECAFRDGVVIDARDRITFEHLHPAFGKAEMDETYQRSNAAENYRAGNAVFERLKAGIRLPYDIDGWCDYRPLYYAIAELMPDGGSFVEVGSWQGQSAVTLCQRLQDIGKTATVYCVDTFQGEQNQPAHVEIVKSLGGSTFDKFSENIVAAGVANMIFPVKGDSAESASNFADGSLDGVFIDAAHDYDSVVKDVAAWFPKVKPGGIFAGHDYPSDGVKRAVDEHATANGYTVSAVGRCWIKNKNKS